MNRNHAGGGITVGLGLLGQYGSDSDEVAADHDISPKVDGDGWPDRWIVDLVDGFGRWTKVDGGQSGPCTSWTDSDDGS